MLVLVVIIILVYCSLLVDNFGLVMLVYGSFIFVIFGVDG